MKTPLIIKYAYSEVLVLGVLLDEVEQLHLQRLDFGLLVVQGQLDLVDLLLDQAELLIGQIGVLGSQLVQIELLLLSSGGLHLSLLLVDGHVQDLIEVRDTFQNTSLDNVEHDSVLQLDSQLVSEGLLLPGSLLLALQHRSISRDDIVQSNGVVLVDQLELNVVDLLTEYWALVLNLDHLLPENVEECNRHLAPSVNVYLVLSDERSVVDHRASVQSFDNELNTIVHVCIYFDHAILNDLHDVRGFINLENLRAFIEFGKGK